MHQGWTVSVAMPAYNEESCIESAVRDFLALPDVDEVLVVDNNSTDDTNALARAAGARVITEVTQGYGAASRCALLNATGDLVLIVEPDGTFVPRDVEKFLTYASEFDAIFGTRTSKSAIWAGANMRWFLRYGNVLVAKVLEYLHNGPCLTDVGCTFKLLHREAVQRIEPYFRATGSHFSPELMLLCIRTGMRCIEIPVHYRSRIGTSKITGSFWRAWRLGWRMVAMIVAYRFRALPRLGSSVPVAVLAEIGERRE
jgi:glycosyltransferase involved in cell wall biosynthesis